MVKLLKDSNTLPYGMLLTRVFRESGIRLDWGLRQKTSVRSYIDSSSLAKMGLRTSERKVEESPRRARTKGEPTLKEPTVKQSRSHSQEIKASSVRVFDSGDLKRKGEPLLSEVSKQARRSPRVKTVQQREAKHSEMQGSKATKSLASILQQDSARKTEDTTRKRTEEPEKKKSQPQKSPRLRKMSARKTGSPSVDTVSQKDKQEAQTVVPAERNLEAVHADTEDVPTISKVSFFEEVVSTTFASSLVSKQVATVIVGDKTKKTVLNVMTNVPSKYLQFRRTSLEHRLVVREEKKLKSVIIRDKPKRYVKAFFKSVVFGNDILHLLDNGYKNFYDQLKRISREPYPPEPSAERPTLHPILASTVIKVVPDLQPPNFIELNFEKKKLSVHPESVLDDMSSEQIAEAIGLIDEACEEKRSGSSICTYQDPGTSQVKATVEDSHRGILRKGQYSPLLIGNLECSYFLLQNILRNRPLWEINVVAEVMPWFGKPVPRLSEADDLDIPEQVLNISPPHIHVIEPVVSSTEAYSTTIASVEILPAVVAEERPVETEPSTATAPPTLEQQVHNLVKDVKSIKKDIKKMKKMLAQVLKQSEQ